MVELPGADGPLYWEHPDASLDAIQEFLTGVTVAPTADRVLATVLYTDIVDSTASSNGWATPGGARRSTCTTRSRNG